MLTFPLASGMRGGKIFQKGASSADETAKNSFPGLRQPTKRQKTVFRAFVNRRNDKKQFSGPSSADETTKNSFPGLRRSTKRQKTLFWTFVNRRNGKKQFSGPSSIDETGRKDKN